MKVAVGGGAGSREMQVGEKNIYITYHFYPHIFGPTKIQQVWGIKHWIDFVTTMILSFND